MKKPIVIAHMGRVELRGILLTVRVESIKKEIKYETKCQEILKQLARTSMLKV